MPHYQSFDPDAELNGRSVLGFITNINHEDIEEILLKHHLDHVDPAQWYKLQQVLDVLSDISSHVNSSENFVALGVEVGMIGVKYLPAAFATKTLEEVMAVYGDLFYTSRHHGFAGAVEFRKENDQRLVLTTCIPYPDDLFYGVFYSYCRHFTPPGKHFVLHYDEHTPRHDNGGPNTIYHIELD